VPVEWFPLVSVSSIKYMVLSKDKGKGKVGAFLGAWFSVDFSQKQKV
jgi:hypothetical protein